MRAAPSMPGRRGSTTTTSGASFSSEQDGSVGGPGGADDEALRADPQQAGQALANAVVGIDEEHAKGAGAAAESVMGGSVGWPTPHATGMVSRIGLRHSANDARSRR